MSIDRRYGRVGDNTPRQLLVSVLGLVFPGNPDLVRRYASPSALNRLLDWVEGDATARWPVAAFVMSKGLGFDGRMYESADIAGKAGVNKMSVTHVVGERHADSYTRLLRAAHKLVGHLQDIPPNELRTNLRLRSVTWRALAESGIYTIDQLCRLTRDEVEKLRGIGENRATEIITQLKGMRRKLR